MKIQSVLAIIVTSLFSCPAVLAGEFTFYDGNGAGKKMLGSLSDSPGQKYNLKKKKPPFTNDEARSVVLHNVRAGAVLTVYDSPDGKKQDDWTRIEVKKQVLSYEIKSFDGQPMEDDVVKVNPHPDNNNGLDGKVSRIEID